MEKFLSHILQHRLINLAAYFILFFVCVIAFTEIADDVVDRKVLWIDEAILHTINIYANSFWDTFFVVATQLGGVGAILAITSGLIALLVLRRKFKAAVTIGVSVVGAAILNVGLKLLFERSRPNLWEQAVVETSFSFPSGHAMISAALGLAIILIYWETRFRWYTVVLVSFYILLIGFSRLYLGVHYPTDIVAGWLVSGAWVSIVAMTLQSSKNRGRQDS